ncbi:MAG: hypothetical protein CME62_13270 [Halobacteriovoraceae bacterium]|nr:hypothetical protein [Halobacteriovoraceae bacterium]|tara:strand:+ start:1198 stop:1611 length:414 start_codon:yes stop_codon:yes gene_type:complete
MSTFTAGKEVLSYCGKCKLALGHTIVVMKDPQTIGKVKCNTCGAVHMYKDPATKTKKVKSKTTSTRKSKKSVSVGQLWMEEMGKASGKAEPYSIRSKFVVGDIIDHKKFGPGIVQALIEDKIEVLFQHELKLLVHGK